MDIRPQLIGLLDYTERMATLAERAVFRLSDYHALLFHESDLKNRIGIHHDVAEGDERAWIKIDRLARTDPPAVPEEIKNWITVSRDPLRQPSVQAMRVVTVKREDAESLVHSGRASGQDVAPAMRGRGGVPPEQLRDVVLRLENDLEAEAAVREYIEGPWTTWAENEKPRRETIRIYEAFFSQQQAIETQGVERPLEVVCGIGVALWNHSKQTIVHPLLEQLVEIDIDPGDGAIQIRPRSAEPALAVKPYQELEIVGADALQRFVREHFKQINPENEFSPFSKTSFEAVLRRASSLLDAEGQYYPDQLARIIHAI